MTTIRPVCLRTIGILGGMSDQATAEYYRLINQAVNQRLGGWDIAETVIIGVNFGNIQHCIANQLWAEAGAYLSPKAQAAERAGADLLICASNTLHCVAGEFTKNLKIPFLHIADPTGEAIRRAGLKKVALLGTKSTMSMPYSRDYYRDKHGLEVIVPSPEDQERLNQIIFDELVRGIVRAESKTFYLDVSARLRHEGAEGVILGCTEIFLLMTQPTCRTSPCSTPPLSTWKPPSRPRSSPELSFLLPLPPANAPTDPIGVPRSRGDRQSTVPPATTRPLPCGKSALSPLFPCAPTRSFPISEDAARPPPA